MLINTSDFCNKIKQEIKERECNGFAFPERTTNTIIEVFKTTQSLTGHYSSPTYDLFKKFLDYRINYLASQNQLSRQEAELVRKIFEEIVQANSH